MGEFSLIHWLVIILILLLFFGPNKLPQLGQGLGRAIRGFKEGLNEINAEARDLPPKQDSQQLNQQQQQASIQQQKQEETVPPKKS